MGRLFGTDGVRGVANVSPMDSETVLAMGRALAHVMKRNEGKHRILIGKDTRLSGYLLETALSSGICSMGVDVLLVGPLPTPGVAFMTRSMRADAGVVISASHNPFEDNGIKIFGPDGFKLPDDVEDEIERLMNPDNLDAPHAKADFIGKASRIDDAVGRYTVYLKSCLERKIKFDGLKLVVDCANGAAYKVAPLVFSELGASLVKLGDAPDGKNINKGVGSLFPELMAKKTREEGANIGIAFDGDADRVIFADETGALLDGDFVLAIIGGYLKKKGLLRNNTVVGTVMSNLGLEVAFKELGIDFCRTAVGDRYVLAKMLEEGYVLGGEQSGHIISLEHNTTGDGILTALLMLSIIVETGKPLSELKTIMKRFPQVTINIVVSRKPPFEEVPKLQNAIKEADHRLQGKGRALVRYSGTEKKLRVMVECEDDGLCGQIANELADVVKSELTA